MTKGEIKNLIFTWDEIRSKLKIICELEDEINVVVYKDPQAFELDEVVREIEEKAQ